MLLGIRNGNARTVESCSNSPTMVLAGNLRGHELSVAAMPRTTEALNDHWFADYFGRLSQACEQIEETFWVNPSIVSFEAIGDLLEEIVALGGVYVTEKSDGSLYVHVPYSIETMPDGFLG